MTKKETSSVILETANKILVAEGPSSLTMRNIAKGSNIALGTIYNYYSTKDDVILAMVNNFWDDTVETLKNSITCNDSFTDELKSIYRILLDKVSQFRIDWLGTLREISTAKKAEGLEYERKIQNHLCEIINTQMNCYYPELPEKLDRADLSEFICDNIFLSLGSGKQDINFLCNIIDTVLK